MNSKRPSKLSVRMLRVGLAGFAAIVGAAAVSTGCLDRPVAPQQPSTTNIVVEKILQEKVDKIDLLFMIDNSISMADKQSILAEAVPELVKRLVTPICLDANGAPIAGATFPCAQGTTAEFEPVNDIHIGVISSSIGGYGGNVCGDDPPTNDRAHLMPSVRSGLSSWNNTGFLWWAPDRGGETNQQTLIDQFKQQVGPGGTGETGCGFEASLEAWYRFLIDPNPYQTATSDGNFVQTRNGTDTVIVDQQRKDFLRSDSLVAIIMLSDENDCSIITENGFIGAYAASINLTLAPGSSQCSNPNDPCCYLCATSPPPGCSPGCPDTPPDPNSDKVNLRCWNQKQRFGIDFLYPTMRYVNALKLPSICPEKWDLNPDGCPVAATPNPLYLDLSGQGVAAKRTQSLVFLAGIVGVPWQDIATDATRDDPTKLEYRRATPAEGSTESLAERWDWITGDVTNPPDDPLMVESPTARTGNHPLDAKYNPQPVTAGELANPINGHEWNADTTARGDLQFACIFDLVPDKDCSTTTGGCDCKPADVTPDQSPLCQNGTNYTSTQRYAKGYPGLRQLQVLRDYGDNSIVASICPKITDTSNKDYGYNPAVAAIIDRLKEALGGKCLPRTIALEDPGTPDDTSDDYVPCKVLEATLSPGSCDCSKTPGRISLSEVEGGSDLDRAVKAQLLKDGICDNKTIMCANYCVCLVQEYTGALKDQCLNDPSFAADAGWCYVDPLPPPVGQNIGNVEIVEGCDPSEKRLLRFEPVAGSVGYIACKGAPFSGEGAGG